MIFEAVGRGDGLTVGKIEMRRLILVVDGKFGENLESDGGIIFLDFNIFAKIGLKIVGGVGVFVGGILDREDVGI